MNGVVQVVLIKVMKDVLLDDKLENDETPILERMNTIVSVERPRTSHINMETRTTVIPRKVEKDST